MGPSTLDRNSPAEIELRFSDRTHPPAGRTDPHQGITNRAEYSARIVRAGRNNMSRRRTPPPSVTPASVCREVREFCRERATGCSEWTLSARRESAGVADPVARRAVKAPHGSMPSSGGAGVPRDIPASRSPLQPRELRRLREPYPFWKNRNRFTADGPSEKKSPDLSGCEQSSSEAPSMSGFGSSSPLTYVPQVERRSTIE